MATDIFLEADRSLTANERRDFLDRFPQQRGAHVADILSMLDDNDSYLDVVESMHEEHGHEVPEPRLLAVATYICMGIYDGAVWGTVSPVISRIRQRMPLKQSA